MPKGEECEPATVETVDPKDPLDLTFVDCASILEDEPQLQKQQQGAPDTEPSVTSTPRNKTGVKRKAKKSSPDAPTASDEELEAGQKEPWVILRKLKSRAKKKKPFDVETDEDAVLGESSSADMPTVSEHSVDRTEKKKKGCKKQPVRKGDDISASEVDSDVEYKGTEYLDPNYSKKLRSRSGNKAKNPPVEEKDDTSPLARGSSNK